MRTLRIGIVSLIGMSLMLFAVPMLHAQGTAQQRQYQPEDPRQVISDTELQAFAQANAKIGDIRTDYESRLQAVQDAKRAKQLQQQAEQEMVAAVTEQGLTVNRYNVILAAVQRNENVRERYNTIQQQGS